MQSSQLNTSEAPQMNAAALAQMEKNKTAGVGGNFQLMPKFMFGFKEDVKGNLFFLDHDVVVYPCGHNIVLYRIDDRSQRFIPRPRRLRRHNCHGALLLAQVPSCVRKGTQAHLYRLQCGPNP